MPENIFIYIIKESEHELSLFPVSWETAFTEPIENTGLHLRGMPGGLYYGQNLNNAGSNRGGTAMGRPAGQMTGYTWSFN